MVFVVSITIFSVLQFLFCLQLFIFWLKADYKYSVYFTSSNMNISIFWQCFLEEFFTGYGPYRFLIKTFFGLWNINKHNFNPIFYWNGFFINLLYLMSGKQNCLYEIRCFIMLKLHITNGENSCLKLYNETYLLDKAW